MHFSVGVNPLFDAASDSAGADGVDKCSLPSLHRAISVQHGSQYSVKSQSQPTVSGKLVRSLYRLWNAVISGMLAQCVIAPSAMRRAYSQLHL